MKVQVVCLWRSFKVDMLNVWYILNLDIKICVCDMLQKIDKAQFLYRYQIIYEELDNYISFKLAFIEMICRSSAIGSWM